VTVSLGHYRSLLTPQAPSQTISAEEKEKNQSRHNERSLSRTLASSSPRPALFLTLQTPSDHMSAGLPQPPWPSATENGLLQQKLSAVPPVGKPRQDSVS
jgi:hypothetical protein